MWPQLTYVRRRHPKITAESDKGHRSFQGQGECPVGSDCILFGRRLKCQCPDHELQTKLLRPLATCSVCPYGRRDRPCVQCWNRRSAKRLVVPEPFASAIRAQFVEEVEPRFYAYFLQSAFYVKLGIFEGVGQQNSTIPNLVA